jgi:hypothetical protein
VRRRRRAAAAEVSMAPPPPVVGARRAAAAAADHLHRSAGVSFVGCATVELKANYLGAGSKMHAKFTFLLTRFT